MLLGSAQPDATEGWDMVHVQALDARLRLSMALLAGLGAGLAAAAAAVTAELALSVHFPLPADTAFSAFFAGVAGGLSYGLLVGNVRRPVSALWILTLGIATVDTLLITLLPLPAGPGLESGAPIDGLIIPIEQIGALLGIWHFGPTHFPAAYLPADALLHYLPALAVAVLVPRWAGHRVGHAP
jgi:hypothetical protein